MKIHPCPTRNFTIKGAASIRETAPFFNIRHSALNTPHQHSPRQHPHRNLGQCHRPIGRDLRVAVAPAHMRHNRFFLIFEKGFSAVNRVGHALGKGLAGCVDRVTARRRLGRPDRWGSGCTSWKPSNACDSWPYLVSWIAPERSVPFYTAYRPACQGCLLHIFRSCGIMSALAPRDVRRSMSPGQKGDSPRKTPKSCEMTHGGATVLRGSATVARTVILR